MEHSYSRELWSEHDVEGGSLLNVLFALPVPLFVKTANRKFVLVNAAAARLMGRPSVDLIGRTDADFFSAEVAQRHWDEDDRVLATGEPLEVEEQLAGLAGGEKIILVQKSRARAPDGQPLVLATVRDVSEARRAAREIAESERHYRLLAENAHDVIWTMDCATQRFTYVSPSVERLRGLSVEEAMGESISDSLTPESFERALAILSLMGKPGGLGPPDGASSHTALYETRCADGSLKQLEITASAIVDEAGRITEILGVSRDVSARERAERGHRQGAARLAQNLATLSGIIESAQYPIFSVDRAYRYTSFNSAHAGVMKALYGVAIELGRPMYEYQHIQADWTLARANLDRVFEGESFIQEAYSGEGDGRAYFEVTHHPVRTPTGEIVGAAVLARDVTASKRSQEALRESEAQLRQSQKMEAIGRLAGGVAHDFNNILSVILCSAEFARDSTGGGTLTDDLDAIQSAGERAQGLTRQLLAFSRKQVLEPRVIDLNAVVGGIEKMLRRLLPEDIHLHTKLRPALGRTEADLGQLEQVLLNLVVNARDAMPRGGDLTLETANIDLDDPREEPGFTLTAGRYVRLSIIDTGCGMEPETLLRIFEPFFTTKEKGKGTGLGLSTAYGIVKQSGGELTVTSTPGTGSVFDVYLPRLAEDAAVAGEHAAEAKARPQPGKTILVVENEDDVRRAAVRSLELLGYHVLSADGLHAAQACWLLCDAPIDLLLTDVVMPGGSGPEVAEALRRRYPGVPTLFMSGFLDDTLDERGAGIPGSHFLQKPFTPQSLAQKVRDVLEAPPPATE